MKEDFGYNEIPEVQTGDIVDKAGKKGEVIQVAKDGVLVSWRDGSAQMTKEDPAKLKKVYESAFVQYMKAVGRL